MCTPADGCCPVIKRLEPGRDSYVLYPAGRNTVYWFSRPFPLGTTTTFDAGTDARLGDTLSIIFQAVPSDETPSAFYLSDAFFYTACETPRNYIYAFARNVIRFTFDGQKWVNTTDMC